MSDKARYTATLVACGWAGAVMENITKSKMGTDRPTDGWTKVGVKSRSTRLKRDV